MLPRMHSGPHRTGPDSRRRRQDKLSQGIFACGEKLGTLQLDDVTKSSTLAFLILLISGFCPAQQMSSGVSVENLTNAGHWKRARQIVEARLKANPRDAFALYMSSKVNASFGNLDKALDQAQKSVALESRNPDYLAQLAEMHVRLADRSSVVKQVLYVRLFKKEVDAALALNPRHVDALLVDAMFLSRAPVIAGGDRKRARALAQQLTGFDTAWGYMLQARLAEQEKDDARTEAFLRQAVDSNPGLYLPRYYLAKFHGATAANRRLDAAEKLARELIQLDPGQSGGYDILARVFAQQHRWQDLDAVLAKSENSVPDDLSPYYFAANILIHSAIEPARAERYLNKYLTQEPEGRQPSVSQGRELLVFLKVPGHPLPPDRPS